MDNEYLEYQKKLLTIEKYEEEKIDWLYDNLIKNIEAGQQSIEKIRSKAYTFIYYIIGIITALLSIVILNKNHFDNIINNVIYGFVLISFIMIATIYYSVLPPFPFCLPLPDAEILIESLKFHNKIKDAKIDYIIGYEPKLLILLRKNNKLSNNLNNIFNIYFILLFLFFIAIGICIFLIH